MSRALVACLTVLGALALLAAPPAYAGGPSAGDQQYIDPLAGSGHHGSSGSHHTSTTPPTSAPAPASSTSSGATSSSSTVSTSATTTASSTATRHDPGKTLPFTGFNALQGALLGTVLVAVGKLLGLAARRA
jgi:hypothetical protein